MKKILAMITFFLFLLPGVVLANGNETKKSEEKKEEYLVMFKEKTKKDFKVTKEDIAKVENEGGKVKENFRYAGVVLVDLTEKKAEKLRKNKNVLAVEKNGENQSKKAINMEDYSMTFENIQAMNYINVEKTWDFSKTDNLTENGWNFGEPGFSGRGINIAIMDDGVSYSADISEKNIKMRINCFHNTWGSELPEDGYDTEKCIETTGTSGNHATMVADVIVGKHNDYGFRGIAPEAGIYSIGIYENDEEGNKIDKNPGGNGDELTRGWNWILEHNETSSDNEKIHILNMSIQNDNKSIIHQEVLNRLYESGVMLVASSGNFSRENIAEYGEDHVSFPAAYNNVIAVGASDSGRNLASFSQRGPEIDILAPGVGLTLATDISYDSTDIVGEDPYEYEFNQYTWDKFAGEPGDGLWKVEGTSFSSPMVAGALALLKEQYPNANNTDLKWMLYARASSNDFSLNHDDWYEWSKLKHNETYGYGILNAAPYEWIEDSGGNDEDIWIYTINSDQTVYSYPSIKADSKPYGKDRMVKLKWYWGNKWEKVGEKETEFGDFDTDIWGKSGSPEWAQIETGEWIKRSKITRGAKFTLWNDTEVHSKPWLPKVESGTYTALEEDDHRENTYKIEYNGDYVYISKFAGTFDKIETVDKSLKPFDQTICYYQPNTESQLVESGVPETINVDRKWKDPSGLTWYRWSNNDRISWISERSLYEVYPLETTYELEGVTPYYEKPSIHSTQRGSLSAQTVNVTGVWEDKTGQKWYQIDTWTGSSWIEMKN